MEILLFVLKYIFISLLLKMMNGFPDQQISWPVPLTIFPKLFHLIPILCKQVEVMHDYVHWHCSIDY